jgi:hypothetical protein
MDQNGHRLCAEHAEKYKPKNIRPAWYIAPEHLKTILSPVGGAPEVKNAFEVDLSLASQRRLIYN